MLRDVSKELLSVLVPNSGTIGCQLQSIGTLLATIQPLEDPLLRLSMVGIQDTLGSLFRLPVRLLDWISGC
jgi:hypothetical protein